MEKIILVRYGEIILKGLNRPVFEDKLIKDIRKALSEIGSFKIEKSQGRIYIEPHDNNIESACNMLKKVFGIVSLSIAWKVKTDFDIIKAAAESVVNDVVDDKARTFKVETKRGDKKFPLKSPEVSAEIGAHLLSVFPNLKVDVINPDFIVYIEIREDSYIHTRIDEAACGLPSCTNGKGMLLISGGIDSPVAGWMLAKRGMEIEAVHFESYPYTTERSREKVIELTRILSGYNLKIKLIMVSFTEIQETILQKCPHDQVTIIMRRFMMRIARNLALIDGCQALVTGESLGQVASQTMQGLSVTDSVVDMPVFRPLIGMDKVEIIDIARRIGTFDTSILPYEDCCTLFVAKHPVTRPRKDIIDHSESVLDTDNLIDRACQATSVFELERGKRNENRLQSLK